MKRKLIKKGQYGMTAPLTSFAMQEAINYSTSMLKPMQKMTSKGIDPNTFKLQGLIQPKTLTSTNLTPKTGGFGGGGISGGAGVAGMVGQAFGALGSMMPDKTDNQTTKALNTGHEQVSNVMSSIPTPITQIIGAAMKAQAFGKKALDNLTGGKTSIENAQTTSDKIMNSNWMAFSGVSELNALTSKKIEGVNQDLANSINSGYAATTGPKTTEIGGLTRLFGGKKVKNKMKNISESAKRADTENALKSSIIGANNKNLIAASNTTQDLLLKNNQQLQGGQNLQTLFAQKGAKLAAMKIFIEKNSAKNVIPEGALHKNKHNIDSDLVNKTTEKGIPVVSGDIDLEEGKLIAKEGGEITQTAEIERDEIIFHKEFTEKLEEFLKEYNLSDDSRKKEIELELGKLLVFEVLENTEDNTGLLDKIE